MVHFAFHPPTQARDSLHLFFTPLVSCPSGSHSNSCSPVSNEVIEDFRRRLFGIFLEHAPGLVGRIPVFLQKHGSTKATLDEPVTRVLWDHFTKGSGECTLGEPQQSTPDVSSGSTGRSTGIDAKAGRAEADKEWAVQGIGKDVGLTFERRSVGG